MVNLLLVMLGGGIGAILRYLVTQILNKKFKLMHWATFWVNVSGCFVMGMIYSHCVHAGESQHAFIVAGILGSYTTFSAFEYENIDLIAHEKFTEFLKYSFSSCLFSFISVAGGFWLAKVIFL